MSQANPAAERRGGGLAVAVRIYDAMGIWFWLIAFAVFFSFYSEHFFSYLNFRNIFRQTSIVGIMSIGMTFVIISGGIDLSVGSVVSFASALMGVVWQATGNMPFAIACALASGLVIGLANGLLVGRCNLPPFVATFGLMSAAAGFAFALTPSSIGDFPAWFDFLGNGMIERVPVPIILLLALAIVFWFILGKRRFGTNIRAIGGNENAARMAGIDVARNKILAYVLNGGMASLAAVVLCSRIRSSYPGIGQDVEMDVIAAAVIGGASLVGGEGRIVGAVGGAVFICMMQNIFNLLGIYPFMQKVITGVFIVIAVFANEMRSRKG